MGRDRSLLWAGASATSRSEFQVRAGRNSRNQTGAIQRPERVPCAGRSECDAPERVPCAGGSKNHVRLMKLHALILALAVTLVPGVHPAPRSSNEPDSNNGGDDPLKLPLSPLSSELGGGSSGGSSSQGESGNVHDMTQQILASSQQNNDQSNPKPSPTWCHPPVEANWSEWGEYGDCVIAGDATCGFGLETRTRTCSNPAPGPGGDTCTGDASSSRACFDDCEASIDTCENANFVFTCPVLTTIEVIEVIYGRDDGVTCANLPDDNLLISDQNCRADMLYWVNLCHGFDQGGSHLLGDGRRLTFIQFEDGLDDGDFGRCGLLATKRTPVVDH
eukprot:maker-scaffold420_size176246-snap-gene-0.21 protein:Tk05638 transcript:maker-scaffold420_size176246-snap-gene-0.21-mRNA-1 annotation:"hypothetical protein BRAFLDRAFT_118911"